MLLKNNTYKRFFLPNKRVIRQRQHRENKQEQQLHCNSRIITKTWTQWLSALTCCRSTTDFYQLTVGVESPSRESQSGRELRHFRVIFSWDGERVGGVSPERLSSRNVIVTRVKRCERVFFFQPKPWCFHKHNQVFLLSKPKYDQNSKIITFKKKGEKQSHNQDTNPDHRGANPGRLWWCYKFCDVL